MHFNPASWFPGSPFSKKIMKQRVDNILGHILAFLMAVMTVDVLWQVCSRYILRSPSPYTDELARFLLIWIGILGAAYVAGQEKHLAIDLLPQKLEGRSKRRLHFFINLLIALFAIAVMVIGGTRLVFITFNLGQTSSALQVPLGYVYAVVPISGLLVVYYKLITLTKSR
jgi:TRAP-type C4-dicarboxylate transport system permease small subunit